MIRSTPRPKGAVQLGFSPGELRQNVGETHDRRSPRRFVRTGLLLGDYLGKAHLLAKWVLVDERFSGARAATLQQESARCLDAFDHFKEGS